MERDEIARIAEAYVEHATWFVREGCDRFSAHQAKLRARFAPQLGAITAAIARGPEAVWSALEAGTDAFSENLAELAFENHPAQWADERVRNVLTACGREGWLLLEEIVRRAPEAPDILGFIGAGPFETWVSEERVEEVRDDLARALAASPKLRQVVLSSWDIPPTLQEMLRAVGAWGAGPGS
jgi:hypothetical protein